MIDVHWLPEAEEDYEEAFEWYYQQSERAAEGLERALGIALQKVQADPGRHPHCDLRHRFVTMKPYPYKIVYRVDADWAVIVAIAHGSRRPGYWRSRDQR